MALFCRFFPGEDHRECTIAEFYGMLGLIPQLLKYERGQDADESEESMLDAVERRLEMRIRAEG